MDTSNVWGVSGNSAEVYHNCFVPTLIDPWAPRTIALADPKPGERVLDVACGSGVVARLAAHVVGPTGQVVGLDSSPEMLAVARKVTAGDGVAAIEWREGAADALPFDDGSFDVVTCQLGLMFFPDRVAALKEMRRVLARKGRVALMTWGPLERCLGQAAVGQVWGEYFGAEQRTQFQPAHSLGDPEAVRLLLNEAGFAEIAVCAQAGRARFLSPQALVCSYGALISLEVDAATRDVLCADVARLLHAYRGQEGLDYPVEAVMAQAYQRADG